MRLGCLLDYKCLKKRDAAQDEIFMGATRLLYVRYICDFML